MTPTTQRAEVLDFPIQYYASPGVLVVNKDETRIDSVADISGKEVGVGTGSSYEPYLERPGDPGRQARSNSPSTSAQACRMDEMVAFQDLALGAGVRLDAIVANLADHQGADRRHRRKFKIVGKPLYGEPNWVAIDKGDPEWEAKIIGTIEALRADGTLAKISQKWLGADITAEDL